MATAPFYPWNGDDMRYLVKGRLPLPTLYEWNPARIFPEIVQPLAGLISRWLIYPITNNYFKSIEITSSIILAFSICSLLVVLEWFLSIFSRNNYIIKLSSVFFIIFSFYIFRKENSIYLFYALNMNLMYFYVIPNILNSILVLIFLRYFLDARKVSELNSNMPFSGFLVLLIYFAQFSMTPSSLISASCASIILIIRVFKCKCNGLAKKVIYSIANRDIYDLLLILTIIFWCIAAIFDMNGPRYNHLRKILSWRETICHIVLLLKDIKVSAIIISLFTLAITISIALYRYKHNLNNSNLISEKNIFYISIIICGSALICLTTDILMTHIIPWYASKVCFMYAPFFYIILLVSICILYLLQKSSFLWLVSPLILCMLLLVILRQDMHWRGGYTDEQKRIADSWFDTIINADLEGKEQVAILVPTKKWPQKEGHFNKYLSRALFRQGLTSRLIKIELKEIQKPNQP